MPLRRPPKRVARRDLRILRPGNQSDENPRVRFTALGLTAKAAVLRLDPLIDRVEYNTLLHLEEVLSTTEIGSVLPELRASNDPALIDFALRIENLGHAELGDLGAGQAAATEIIDTRPAATVLDLGGFKFKEEPLVVALSVLDDLWSRRSERRPFLLVIDEAHNLCSPEVETALERAVLDRIIQIAAEGTKVRPLAAALDTAPVPGASGDHLSMRQPRADADEFAAGPRRAGNDLRLRTTGTSRPVTAVSPGRGVVRRRIRASAEHGSEAATVHP